MGDGTVGTALGLEVVSAVLRGFDGLVLSKFLQHTALAADGSHPAVLSWVASVGRTGTGSLSLTATLSLLSQTGSSTNTGGSLDGLGTNPAFVDELANVVGLDGRSDLVNVERVNPDSVFAAL